MFDCIRSSMSEGTHVFGPVVASLEGGSLIFHARPVASRPRTSHQVIPTSHQRRPCRAELGKQGCQSPRMNDGKKESYRPIQHRPVRRYGPCRGHHGRPSILLRFRKPASPVAPILSSLTMRANALTQPVAYKQLAALQAATLLALVLAFRLWLQFATARRNHASRKRLSKQFHPERVVTYPQRRHSTFCTWPPAPKPPTTSMRR